MSNSNAVKIDSLLSALRHDRNGEPVTVDDSVLTAESPEAKPFNYRRFRSLSRYLNETVEYYPENIASDEFNANKDEFIALTQSLPEYFDSREDFLFVLGSIPNGLTAQEGSYLADSLKDSEYAFEAGSIWKAESFGDTLYEVKDAVYLEFDGMVGDNVCTFSFTDKVLSSEGGFQDIILNYGSMNKVDIDNLLLMIRANCGMAWDESEGVKEWQIPAGFEETFIQSIVESGYSFRFYDYGPTGFIEPFRIAGMNRIADFLETRSHERLIG